jgi:hypothetical protein
LGPTSADVLKDSRVTGIGTTGVICMPTHRETRTVWGEGNSDPKLITRRLTVYICTNLNPSSPIPIEDPHVTRIGSSCIIPSSTDSQS